MTLIGDALLVLAGPLLLGLWAAARANRIVHLGVSGFLAMVPLLGLGLVSLVTLLVGHLALLGEWLPWAGLGVGALLVVVGRHDIGRSVSEAGERLIGQWRLAPISVSAVMLGLVMAALASLAPPFRVDEVEYHWAAPAEWVEAGRWIASSYRHVDGFPLMEIAYTYAATVGSYAGAHLMHLSTLVGLGLSAAVAAKAVGVRATGATAAAVVAMPVMWDQAYVAYNDTAMGAFSVAAAAVAVVGLTTRSRMVLVCVLLALAISIKPIAVGAVGVVGLIILVQEIQQPGRFDRESVLRVARGWVPLVVTALATLAFWTGRRFMLTGGWVDPTLTTPTSADPLSRMPSTLDHVIAPVMPFVLGLIGSQEPWGGRLGVVVPLFLLPTLLFVLWKRGDMGARFALVAIPAWVHWLVVGLVRLRTRFHLIVWTLMVVSMRVVVEDAMERYPRLRSLLGLAWGGAVVLSVVDASFEMIRTIRTIEW